MWWPVSAAARFSQVSESDNVMNHKSTKAVENTDSSICLGKKSCKLIYDTKFIQNNAVNRHDLSKSPELSVSASIRKLDFPTLRLQDCRQISVTFAKCFKFEFSKSMSI